VLGPAARQLLCEADVILALDWVDLGGALRQAKQAGKLSAKVIGVTLDHNLHTGANMEHQSLPALDVTMAAGADTVVLQPAADDPDPAGFVRFAAEQVRPLLGP